MIVLSVDSSSLVTTVALLKDEFVLGEYTLNFKREHSVILMEKIEMLLNDCQIDISEVDGFVVSKGPGSFTGLRIGMATIKGLSMGANKPYVSISSLDALANSLITFDGIICPIMDARRGQVYTGIFRFNGTVMETIKPQCIMMIDDLITELDKIKAPVMFLGDGIDTQKDTIEDKMITEHHYAPASMNRQKASSLAALAEIYYAEGKIETAREHKPEYLRLSQAERELKEKMKHD